MILDVFSTSSAGCGVVNNTLEKIIDRRFKGTGSHINTMHKDLAISMGLGEDLGVPLHMAAAAMQIFHAGKTRYPDGDNWVCTRVIGEIIGAELQFVGEHEVGDHSASEIKETDALKRVIGMAHVVGSPLVRIMTGRKENILRRHNGAGKWNVARGAWDRTLPLIAPAVDLARSEGVSLATQTGDALKAQFAHFPDVIAGKAPPLVPARSAIRSLKIIEAIKEAAATRRFVALTPPRP